MVTFSKRDVPQSPRFLPYSAAAFPERSETDAVCFELGERDVMKDDSFWCRTTNENCNCRWFTKFHVSFEPQDIIPGLIVL